MRVSALIIGTEILTGKIKDTNGPWLIEQSQFNGLTFSSLSIVNDDWNEFQKSLTALIDLSDCVIISGGLGPTKDDKTKQFLARYFNLEIIHSEQAQKIAEQTYARFDRDFSQSSNEYNLVPEGFKCLDNPKGFAPALHYKFNDKVIYALPGVPRELKAITEELIFPELVSAKFNESPIRLNFRTKLIPEERIFKDYCPKLWDEFEKWGSPFSLPNLMGVDIGVMLSKDKYQPALEYFESYLSKTDLIENIWQVGNIALEEYVVKKAIDKDITIATAESCTGGLVGHRLTNVAGSSSVVMGGVISYSNEMKTDYLNVSEDILELHGAVSEQTAQAMAIGLSERSRAKLNISFTGIAGPGGGSEQKPVGTVCIALADHRGIILHSKKYHFMGDREKLKERFSTMGLYILLDQIERS